MKKTAIKLMGILLITVSMYSCKKDDAGIDTTNDGTYKLYTQGKVTYVQNLIADTIIGVGAMGPYGAGVFTYFSLERSEVVTDTATKTWDLGFKGNTITINGGTSGNKMGGAYVQVAAFDDVLSVSTDSTFRVDAGGLYAIPKGAGKGWYSFLDAPTNTILVPIAGRTLIIRTASGKYAKVEIQNYYKGGVTPATTATDDEKMKKQRYYALRYTYQSNGSMTF